MSWSGDLGLRVDVNRSKDGSATVRLAGELDVASAGIARRAVEQFGAGTKRIVLDLSRVTFFDAAGIRFLFAAREQASAAGGDLVLRRPSTAVRRVLELTGALPLFCADGPGGIAREVPPDPDAASPARRWSRRPSGPVAQT
jgi:anti-anti-sigma factor